MHEGFINGLFKQFLLRFGFIPFHAELQEKQKNFEESDTVQTSDETWQSKKLRPSLVSLVLLVLSSSFNPIKGAGAQMYMLNCRSFFLNVPLQRPGESGMEQGPL